MTKVRRTVALTRAQFDEFYVEPVLERWALEPPPVPAPEPEVTLDSSESGGVRLSASGLGVQRNGPTSWLRRAWAMIVSGFETSFAATARDSSSSSGESHVSWGVRSPRQPRSLPELPSEQSQHDEADSWYEADDSENADSSGMSSTTGSDPSSTQYTPDTSSSYSDHTSSDSSSTQYTPDASSSDSNPASSFYFDDAGSSDSDLTSSSDSDSEARYISSQVNAVTREHHEQMAALRERAESSNTANQSSETLLPPVTSGTASMNMQLAELRHSIDSARQAAHTGMSHSYGEYRANIARLEEFERELNDIQQQVDALYWQHQ